MTKINALNFRAFSDITSLGKLFHPFYDRLVAYTLCGTRIDHLRHDPYGHILGEVYNMVNGKTLRWSPCGQHRDDQLLHLVLPVPKVGDWVVMQTTDSNSLLITTFENHHINSIGVRHAFTLSDSIEDTPAELRAYYPLTPDQCYSDEEALNFKTL